MHLGQAPCCRRYHPLASFSVAYLHALSQAVRELAEPELSTTNRSGRKRRETEADVDEEPDEPTTKRRQSIRARNLRLIRNFVGRNLRLLEQAQFRDGVGSAVVIPNVVILNWVCWWVATKDEERPGELVEERLRLWRVLWGDDTSPGYLKELDDEQRVHVLEHFHTQRFEIRRSLQRQPDGGLRLVDIKTARSRRVVPLPASLADALHRHKERQEAERERAGEHWNESGLVFTTSIGTPIHPRNGYRSFRSLIRRAGLRTVRLHDLRHTAASILLAQGVPARVIMEILGHSQINVTLDLYSHVAPELSRVAADQMEQASWSDD